MNKIIKIIVGVICCIFIFIGVLYFSKESPRVYLNNTKVAYVNENIGDKNLENIFEFMNEVGVPIDKKTREGFKYIKNIYLVSDSKLTAKRKSRVLIVDCGYFYPIIKWNLKKYFDKSKENNMYILKKSVQNRNFYGKTIYLKVKNGNFLLSDRENDIKNIIENKNNNKNNDIIKIIDRERKNNLGIGILDVKNRFSGFEELTVAGDIDKNQNVVLTINIGGKNKIIKNFDNILNDGLSGDRYIEKNKLYFRTSNKDRLETYVFFMDYLLNNSIMHKLSSKIYINTPKDDAKIKHKSMDSLTKINMEKKQFLYGNFAGIYGEIIINKIEIKGLSDTNKLKVIVTIDKESAINLLKEKIGG